MIDPLRTAAARWPDAPALTDATTTRSWFELLGAAVGLGAVLDTPPGTRVGVLVGDSAAAVVAIHAVRLARGVLVPLHRRLAPAELVAQATRAGVGVLLHDASHAAVAADLGDHTGVTRVVDIDAAPTGATSDPWDLDPSSAGAIIHTSGTTLAPRGVVLTHKALLASADAWNEALASDPTDHWLSTLPLAHVAGLGMVLRSVRTGARLTVHDRFEPLAVRGAIEHEGVTLVSLVPTQLARLLETGPLRDIPLRAVLLGGGPVSPDIVRRALDAGLPVVTTYGLTEAGSGVTALPANEAAQTPGSAGRPLPGVRVRLVDADGVDVESGATGSIMVGGPILASGYDADPDATRTTFGDGWLRTRDLGRLDDEGRLWVLDRSDELIISGGENISPAEVEGVLAEHPALADVAVVGRPHPIWGAVPVVVIVPGTSGPAPTIGELRAFGRGRLAGFKLPIASSIIDAVPRTTSGKVIRREVAAVLDAPRTASGTAGTWQVARPDGAAIHVETLGAGQPVVLLHATLSNTGELRGLAEALSGGCRVVSLDRRSAGASVMPPDDAGGAIDIATHIEDILAVVDVVLAGAPFLVAGHSFGGCVALELAARHVDRVLGVWVFEPPYLPLVSDHTQLATLGDRIDTLAREQGPTAAALAFLDAVRGPGTADRLPEAARVRLGTEGRAAVADAALLGLAPDALGRIVAPVVVGLGGRDRAPYPAVAEALAGHIRDVTIERFEDLGHGGPISRPVAVAGSIIGLAGRIERTRAAESHLEGVS